MRSNTQSTKLARFPKAVGQTAESSSEASTARAKSRAKNAKVVCLVNPRQSMPTPAQREALVLKYREKARKLGRSMLRRWHARLDREEVESIVDLSLCEAAQHFNPHKGASFMTFLFYHMKGNMVRAVASAAAAGSIPALNLEASEGSLAQESEHFLGHQFRVLNSTEVADALTSEDVPMPDEVLLRKELQGRSASACEKLDSLEREIVKRMFIQEQQIMEIAAALGYSRCHISRVKRKALDALQQELGSSVPFADLGGKGEEVATEELSESTGKKRRPVFRRRPRSKAALQRREDLLREAA
jgi:RNA polymerase sigma factor (sigma-70 family)